MQCNLFRPQGLGCLDFEDRIEDGFVDFNWWMLPPEVAASPHLPERSELARGQRPGLGCVERVVVDARSDIVLVELQHEAARAVSCALEEAVRIGSPRHGRCSEHDSDEDRRMDAFMVVADALAFFVCARIDLVPSEEVWESAMAVGGSDADILLGEMCIGLQRHRCLLYKRLCECVTFESCGEVGLTVDARLLRGKAYAGDDERAMVLVQPSWGPPPPRGASPSLQFAVDLDQRRIGTSTSSTIIGWRHLRTVGDELRAIESRKRRGGGSRVDSSAAPGHSIARQPAVSSETATSANDARQGMFRGRLSATGTDEVLAIDAVISEMMADDPSARVKDVHDAVIAVLHSGGGPSDPISSGASLAYRTRLLLQFLSLSSLGIEPALRMLVENHWEFEECVSEFLARQMMGDACSSREKEGDTTSSNAQKRRQSQYRHVFERKTEEEGPSSHERQAAAKTREAMRRDARPGAACGTGATPHADKAAMRTPEGTRDEDDAGTAAADALAIAADRLQVQRRASHCTSLVEVLDVFGVPVKRTGGEASAAELRRAYLKAAMRFHPDRSLGASLRERRKNEEIFKVIQQFSTSAGSERG